MIKLSAMRYENCALLCCKQHDSEHTVEVPQYSAHPCVRVCVCLSVYEYIFCNFISQTQSARNYILKLRWLFVRFHFQFSTFILLAHHFCPYYNVCVCVCTFLPFNHYIEERGTGSICVLFHYKHRFNRFFSSVLPAIC